MPDFSARLTVPSATEVFEDTLGTPSRLNPAVGHPHRFVRVATGAVTVQAKATVAGVEGEIDANLGGRLFQWWWTQWPGYPAVAKSLPVITHPVGQSSVADVPSFPSADPDWAGLWILMCWRPSGGGVLIPFNVQGL